MSSKKDLFQGGSRQISSKNLLFQGGQAVFKLEKHDSEGCRSNICHFKGGQERSQIFRGRDIFLAASLRKRR